MKKYMFVIPTLSYGGAERVISVLSTALSEKREVIVLKYYDVDDDYKVGDKVKVINLSGGDVNAYRQINYVKKLHMIRQIIKKEKPDFVIPFLFHVSLAVVIATLGLKTTVLQSIRIDPASAPANGWMRWLRDRLVYSSKATFVQNEKQKQYFKKKSHHKIHVLYNPVSEYLFDCRPMRKTTPFAICSMGRLETQKNFPMLIDAFELAFKDNNDVELLIYGKGSQEENLNNYIKSKGLDKQIKLMGRTSDVKGTYEKVNMFVLSSDFEGMPNALIEAMAAGLPCISTDCPTGPSDLIINGENGLLVPVNDAKAMADAMKKVYYGEVDKTKLGAAARQTITDKCSADKIADKLINICENFN